MRLELDALRRENEELKRDAREHVCLSGGEEHPDVHRLREELDITKRNLRHATKLIHDWSGQLIVSNEHIRGSVKTQLTQG